VGVRNDPDAVGRRAARSCGRAGATPARLEADELPEHFSRRRRLTTKLGAPTMTSHNTP
jgi:hypothetical protein